MIRPIVNGVWDRWVNSHPLLRFMGLCALAAGCFVLAVRPGYRVFRNWRMERNLDAARVAVENQRMDEARDLSLSVLGAGDPRIEALRILEESTASLGDPRHGEIARALMSHPESSDGDRLKGFRGIADDTPLGQVGVAWTSLPDRCRREPGFANAFADRLILEHRLKEAASVLLEVPEGKRDGGLDRRLVRVLIENGSREGFNEAQKLIVAGFRLDGPEASAWLDLLERIPAESLESNLLEPIRSRLSADGGRDMIRRRMLLARMDYAAAGSARAEVIERAVRQWRESAPAGLAVLLRDLGLHGILLENIPVDRVDSCPELFPLLLESMERTRAWDKVPELLDRYGHLVPRFEELGHRAILAAGRQDPTVRAGTWSEAIAEAKVGSGSRSLLKLRDMASKAGMKPEADEAMIEAIRLGRGPLPLYSDLKPLLVSLVGHDRENTLLEICSTYLAIEPGNPVLLTQYAYLACFNNVAEPSDLVKLLEPLAKALPAEIPIRCVLATAYLCGGQKEKAAQTLDPLKIDPAGLSPEYRAVYLVTQVLNHRMAKTHPDIAGFPWGSLEPSAQRKFGELLRSAQP